MALEYTKHSYWHRQIDELAHEMSKLAIACDIPLLDPQVAERVIRGDETVCGRRNEAAFRKLRGHLMAFFEIRGRAIERLGAEDTREVLDAVRAAIRRIRNLPEA